ncbi:integrase [Caulobacter zeae]|uniref:Integrase n=1 Tax=Caulobacter zeae TaxID=2055137 RepID=A0A2N5DG85_9CAUL|nr:tyrosine-type recombinase/integrase [Caulobacter zeae]PLR25090.1 integrase [Caulobacter zeae]
MSVYLPKKSRFYAYDFVKGGKRYTGSTGVETLRKAQEVERKIRNDVALGLHDTQAGMTLDQGAGQWWSEVGQHLNTAEDAERRIEILLRLIGKDTRLVDITTRTVARAIEKRRGETYAKGKDRPGAPAKRYPISNATVNADIIVTLRRILRRAEVVWEVKPLPAIDWKVLTLKEPEPEIRLYTAKQRAAWAAGCDVACRFPLKMLIRYGLRLNELFFPPEAYLPADEEFGPRLAINKRKRGVMLLPLREDDAREIAARVSRAQALGLESIWYEEEAQPARGRYKAKKPGDPITYYGLSQRLKNGAKRAGLKMPRLIHGARHHAGTVMLGKTGNLKLTQQLLGHADIKSTLRYAHALESDLRAALEDDGIRAPTDPQSGKQARGGNRG